MIARTLYDKLWDAHVVHSYDDKSALIYIDRHLIHEVTSPQAFEGLRIHDRKPWRINANLAVPDHNVSTQKNSPVDPISKLQLDALDSNCKSTGITKFSMQDPRQGIVHIIGPEQGASLPGMTIVCGDSHTSTNGALGALAFGIGTSEVEHVLATQCLVLNKARNMRIIVNNQLSAWVTAKDMILAIIGTIGTAGGKGHTIEFSGTAISALSMEARMTICNMSIEAGARAGLIAVDTTTLDYVKGKPFAPTGELWSHAVDAWQDLYSDKESHFDKTVDINAANISPQVTWGTSPDMVLPINGKVPYPKQASDSATRQKIENALTYMDLKPGVAIEDIYLDKIFIGSCTNARIEDLRSAAAIIKGKNIANNITLAIVVPGSGLVKQQAEQEGLDKIFTNAGFEWRDPGCSMCLGMNADKLDPGERCAATSNRNFEGRQGRKGRTHLVSPIMAAAAAVAGHFIDARELQDIAGVR